MKKLKKLGKKLKRLNKQESVDASPTDSKIKTKKLNRPTSKQSVADEVTVASPEVEEEPSSLKDRLPLPFGGYTVKTPNGAKPFFAMNVSYSVHKPYSENFPFGVTIDIRPNLAIKLPDGSQPVRLTASVVNKDNVVTLESTKQRPGVPSQMSMHKTTFGEAYVAYIDAKDEMAQLRVAKHISEVLNMAMQELTPERIKEIAGNDGAD